MYGLSLLPLLQKAQDGERARPGVDEEELVDLPCDSSHCIGHVAPVDRVRKNNDVLSLARGTARLHTSDLCECGPMSQESRCVASLWGHAGREYTGQLCSIGWPCLVGTVACRTVARERSRSQGQTTPVSGRDNKIRHITQRNAVDLLESFESKARPHREARGGWHVTGNHRLESKVSWDLGGLNVVGHDCCCNSCSLSTADWARCAKGGLPLLVTVLIGTVE